MGIIDRFSRTVAPRNNGSPNIARSAIDNVLVAAKQQYDNALSVNARPVVYYMKKIAGLRCTCSHTSTLNPDGLTHGLLSMPGTVTQVASDGFGSQDFIDGVLEGTSFKINRYGTRPNSLDNIVPQQGPANGILDRKSTDIGDPFSHDIVDQDIEDFIEPSAGENALSSASPTGCAVCMNTGFVGGYDPFNYKRDIFDAQYEGWLGVSVDKGTRPATLIPINQVSINIQVPRGVVQLVTVKLWNNKELVSNVAVTTTNNQSLATTVIQAAGGDFPLFFDFTNASSQTFTHLEVMYDIGNNPLLVEWSKIVYDENLDVIDQIADVNLIISSSLPQANLYDIIYETTFNRLWKISSGNTNFDREKHVNGWNVNARLIQPYELFSLLPRLDTRRTRWGNRVIQPLQQQPGVAPIDVITAGNTTPYR